MKPKLVINCGGMFSGKSTELMRQGERHIIAGHKVIFLKPKLDNRYSIDEIVNHNGQKVTAINIDPNENVLLRKEVVYADIILIDEVQFLESIVENIHALLKLGKIIYCSGLDMDYHGNPFEIVSTLMAQADEVYKFHAVCSHCGEDASFSHRFAKTEDRIALGSKDKYIPLCRKCYYSCKE